MERVPEQRRSTRIARLLNASVGTATRAIRPALLVKVTDISTNGIGIHSPEKFDVETVLTIKLYSQKDQALPLRLGRVIHASEQNNGTWKMGIELLVPFNENELQFLLE